MREPPRLDDSAIVAALHAFYGIGVSALTFLPIGHDSASSVYRVDADNGTAHFLKVRTAAGFSVQSLVVPQYLQDHGVPHIVAPLPTRQHTLWVSLDDFKLSLYPFLDVHTAADVRLTEAQWQILGATLRQIHTVQLPADVLRLVGREAYTPSRRDVLTTLGAVIGRRSFADPAERELAAFCHARWDEIRTVVSRADALGHQLRKASLPTVLCHADVHTWNVLLDSGCQLWLVDWDETILAPKERDLMFVIGGIGRDLVSPRETECFLHGYENSAIDLDALVYYRYAWAVQDMGAYAEEVFLAPDLGEKSRRAAVRDFIAMFEAGNIISIARASDGPQTAGSKN